MKAQIVKSTRKTGEVEVVTTIDVEGTPNEVAELLKSIDQPVIIKEIIVERKVEYAPIYPGTTPYPYPWWQIPPTTPIINPPVWYGDITTTDSARYCPSTLNT